MLWFLLYTSSIVLANIMIQRVGMCVSENGPCLIPVGFGLMATSGTIMIGLSFTFRDLLQNSLGKKWTFIGIVLGCVISIIMSTPQVAVASGITLLISESADFLVYTPLRDKHMLLAVFLSNVVGLCIDTFLFIMLAFGPERLHLFVGQAVGKLEMTVLSVCVLYIWRNYGNHRESTKEYSIHH